jgi:hypothetical protein
MIRRRVVAFAISLAASATACSLIVIGQLGDAKDYPLADGGLGGSSGNTSSGASSGVYNPCNILNDPFDDPQDPGKKPPVPSNECSDCIQQQCPTDLTNMCNDGEGGAPASWYGQIRNCAQGPYLSDWNCSEYEYEPDTYTGHEKLATDEYMSKRCIHEKCTDRDAAAPAPCALCKIQIRDTTSQQQDHDLKDDKCGGCIYTNCRKELSDCCTTDAVTDFITSCAYTDSTDNLTQCLKILAFDGGPNPPIISATTCATRIRDCMVAHQCDQNACRPPG